MNINTGREFDFTNPQDDPQKYATSPPGFRYDWKGRLVANPMSNNMSNYNTGNYMTLNHHCNSECGSKHAGNGMQKPGIPGSKQFKKS